MYKKVKRILDLFSSWWNYLYQGKKKPTTKKQKQKNNKQLLKRHKQESLPRWQRIYWKGRDQYESIQHSQEELFIR